MVLMEKLFTVLYSSTVSIPLMNLGVSILVGVEIGWEYGAINMAFFILMYIFCILNLTKLAKVKGQVSKF